MKVGDLIYDSFYEQIGLIIKVSDDGKWLDLLYTDGDIHVNVVGIEDIEVIS